MKIHNPFAPKKRTTSTVAPASAVSVADAARDKREWNEAAKYYNLHLESSPKDFGIWVQYGHALKESGQLEQAKVAYEEADRLSPNDADLILNRAHLAKLCGDYALAATLYKDSARLNPAGAAVKELAQIQSLLKKPRAKSRAAASPAPTEGDPEIEATDKSSPKPEPEPQPDPQPEPKPEPKPQPPVSPGAVDSCECGVISGWVSSQTAKKVSLEILVGDQVVGRGRPTFHRPDVEAAGFGGGLTGFRISVLGQVLSGDTVSVRVAGEDRPFGSIRARPSRKSKSWKQRNSRFTRDQLTAIKQTCNKETDGLKLSIILPVQKTADAHVKQAVDSLLDQWCDNWEVLCIEDDTVTPNLRDTLTELSNADERIITISLEGRVSLSKAVNAGLAAATGNYIAVMDPSDLLEPEAVYRILDAALSNPGVIYTDVAHASQDAMEIEYFSPRPAFSHEYFINHPYIDHLVCVDTEIARAVEGYADDARDAPGVDFLLRVIEKTNDVVHIPAVLLRHRANPRKNTPYRRRLVREASLAAINNHLARIGSEAVAHPGVNEETFRIDYPDKGGRTLIIIPTKDRIDLLQTCLESLWRTVKSDEVDIVVIDHESRDPESIRYFKKISKKVRIYPYQGSFNFGRMNNQAFADCWDGQEYVLFLNNDIEAIKSGWLERMRAQAARPEVGVVGANLLYGDGRVQHCGVIIGMNGAADHGHKLAEFEFDGSRLSGYGNSLTATRDYSAVTAACMLMRSEIFQGVGGYDQSLEIGFNDTDLCLRVGSLGYAILNEAHAILFHHESATRSKTATLEHPEDSRRFIRRWNHMISVGDPFYSPLLSSHIDYAEGEVKEMYSPPRHRRVRPKIRPLRDGLPRQVPSRISLHP